MPQISISDYAANGNNPIIFNDPNGDLFGISGFGSSKAQRQSARAYADITGGEVHRTWSRWIHVETKPGSRGTYENGGVVVRSQRANDRQFFTKEGRLSRSSGDGKGDDELDANENLKAENARYQRFVAEHFGKEAWQGGTPYDPPFGPFNYEGYLIPLPPIGRGLLLLRAGKGLRGAGFRQLTEEEMMNIWGKGLASGFEQTSLQELQAVARANSAALNAFFKGGSEIPERSVLEAYRELSNRIITGTGGATARMATSTAVAEQSRRIEMINNALK